MVERIYLADDSLDRHATKMVEVVRQLQGSENRLFVHHLDLRVVGEGCPGDVPILGRLAELILLCLRWAVQAHPFGARHVQRADVGMHCVDV